MISMPFGYVYKSRTRKENRIMEPQKYILTHKEDLISLINNAVITLNRERKPKHSMHNLAQDFKDNLHQDLPDFCTKHGFEYIKSGLSQKIIINGTCIKIKIHNSLSKYKRSLVNQVEHFNNQLHLFEITNNIILDNESNWELGIELSKNRDKLLYIRLADFTNEDIILIYSHKDNMDRIQGNELQPIEKNQIKTKVISSQEKEKIKNGI